ncbi:MAG: hypothetical protein ABI838_08090 [Chloroflexota bacterium]
MREDQSGARAGRPNLLRRVMESLRPEPVRCAFCPGVATDGWMFDAFGRAYGWCSHCLERMHSNKVAGA